MRHGDKKFKNQSKCNRTIPGNFSLPARQWYNQSTEGFANERLRWIHPSKDCAYNHNNHHVSQYLSIRSGQAQNRITIEILAYSAGAPIMHCSSTSGLEWALDIAGSVDLGCQQETRARWQGTGVSWRNNLLPQPDWRCCVFEQLKKKIFSTSVSEC